MTTRTREAEVSLLNSRIDILNGDAAGASPAKQVFRAIGVILNLIRDEMIDDEDSVQLSEYCFNVREVLKTVIQGSDVGGFDESVRMGLGDLERAVSGIELTLRKGTDIPNIKYNKEKVEGHKLKIQEILGTLDAQTSPFDKNLRVGERVPHIASINPPDTVKTSVSEIACARLIRRAFAPHELPTLIEAISSSKDDGCTIRRLLRDDAQTLVDVIDEALDGPDLAKWARKKCLKSLYRTCGHHALLPSTLKIPICYDRTGVALYRGGFADVWKGEHCGRDVAVKVIRMYSNSDLQKIIGRFCKEVVTWKTLRHPNVLPLIGVTMSEAQFAMISDWMVNGNINDFVKAHPDANRLELLGGVARGLIYIHDQGMIHGDLKGANILIDQTCHARLADFGLLTIISDPRIISSASSYTQGGTARWMSPELIAPRQFGLKNSRPTKQSDCYALGMVIYETIRGHLPFHRDADLAVFVNVLAGRRPSRGAGFTDSLWKMLELCWTPEPNNRPSVEDVLQCLETISKLPKPYSLGVDEETESSNDSDSTAGSVGVGYGHGANTSFSPSSFNFPINSVNDDARLNLNWATGTTSATSAPLSPSSSSIPLHVRDKPTTGHETCGETGPQIYPEKLSPVAPAISTDPPKERNTELRGSKLEEVTVEPASFNVIPKLIPPVPGSDGSIIEAGYERGIGNNVLRELPSPATPSSPRYSASSEPSPRGITSPVDGDPPGTLKGQWRYPWMGDTISNSAAMRVPSESTLVPAKEGKPGIRPLPPRPALTPVHQVNSYAPLQPLPISPHPLPSSYVPSLTTPTMASMPTSHAISDNTGNITGKWQRTLQLDRRKSLPRLVVDPVVPQYQQQKPSGPASLPRVPPSIPSEDPPSSRRPPKPQTMPSFNAQTRASVFDDNFRPSVEKVYERLGDFFPEHNLDEPVIEASPGGTSPMSAEASQSPPTQDRRKRRKSVRVVTRKIWEPEPIFKWFRGELIDNGGYDKLYMALNATTGEIVTVKRVEIPSTESNRTYSRMIASVEELKLEGETLKDLDHPNIVQCLGFEETPAYFSVFLEYVPGGSIASILRKQGRFEENVTKSFTAQILDGLDYLHSKGIIHRDLKADNILVEEFGLCKITNFGISKHTEDADAFDPHTPMEGTAFWMAPEIINSWNKGYNSKVDIWSAGCVVFEMWTAERPWNGQEAAAVFLQLYQSKVGPPVPEGVVLSPHADDLRKRCFAANPEERPTAGELRKHPYLVLPPGWEFNGFR